MTPASCHAGILARAQTSVAWLSKRRRIEVRKAVLVSHNGACMLSFTEVEPPAPTGPVFTGGLGAVPQTGKRAGRTRRIASGPAHAGHAHSRPTVTEAQVASAAPLNA